MACVAMTPNEFKGLCETTNRVFKCLDPKYINSNHTAGHFQKWADVTESDPPFLNIYQELDGVDERINYSIMYQREFVVGNIIVIFDELVAAHNAIVLTGAN